MPEKPLLIFPQKINTVREKKETGFGASSYNYPEFSKQKDRLTPLFESMQQSFIVDVADGLEPEYALVIETIGQIDDFQRAVDAIDSLEWLAEIDEETIEPDDNFYQGCKIGKALFCSKIESINRKQSSQIWNLLKENGFWDNYGYLTDKNIAAAAQFIPAEFLEHSEEIINIIRDTSAVGRKKSLSGRLFLAMSNKQAIDKLLSLWGQWDSGGKKLPRPYGKWTEIFKQTKTIRRWDIQDRILDTGIVDFWAEQIELKKGTASKIAFEIELWYRNDANLRNEIETKISNFISNEKGNIIASCIIKEIRFHAIKAELPVECIEDVLDSEYRSVFLSDDVRFFMPVGQCRVELYPDGTERDFETINVAGKPVVAILDGAPFVNHSLLENRLIVDDPDNFENAYQANARKHGTAMASLVCYGELDTQEEPLRRPVYFRPIMKPDPDDLTNTPPAEIIPKEYFMEDLIERSVRRIFEGDNNEDAVAPTIKIINLSIADSSKMFFNQLSSCAKLLDWLSYKYQVLFCVSAGNINTDIDLQKNINELKSLSKDDLLKHTILEIYKNIRNRRILSPADSINSITLGSIHSDKSTINNIGRRFDILPDENLPSPISSHGLGYKHSIKPELYISGGRQLYDAINTNYCISKSGLAPGQCVATSPTTGGEVNRCVYTRGTSNSAALATRSAAQIYEMLNSLILENDITIDENNVAVILKALLVHGASWDKNYDILKSTLKTSDNSRIFKKDIARYIGFGIPDIYRVLGCASQRVTVIGYGKIKKDNRHNFRFPWPPSLTGSNEMRRLTITLAWFTPINPASRKYRKANLSIEPPTDIIGVNRINANWQQVKNGTLQHEILEGNNAVSFQDGDAIPIAVECREDAGSLEEEVFYGLAVTLEIAEGLDLPIYDEIKDRISIPIQVEEQI